MISDNLLREPDNAKFQQFKPTNNAIKKRLVDVKGALEYAVAVSTPSRQKFIAAHDIHVFVARIPSAGTRHLRIRRQTH